MTEQKRTGSLPELLRFFLPLAVTWMLMMITHTIISAGLSRTINPTVSTAAYAVALSLASIIDAPFNMLRQTGMAFISSPQTFQVVRRVTYMTLVFFMAIAIAIGYIPALEQLVFKDILGVSDELLAATITAFRVTMLLSLANALRCLYQSMILINKHTTYISTGMFLRVGVMVLLIYCFANFHWVVGPLVGSITLVVGLSVEGIVAYWFGRRLIPEGDTTVAPRTVWTFYLPLIASSLFVAMGKPFINAGLARMPDAAVYLAAFSVASSFAWVLISPTQNIHQVTMVFGRHRENRPLVQKFAVAVAIISTTALLAISLSPLGRWVLTNLIQVPTELVEPTLMGMRTFAFFPPILCWLEYNTGLMLLAQATRLVSLGKTINLLTTIAFVLILAPLVPGAIAAPLAQILGFASEGLVLQLSLSLEKRGLIQRAH